MQPLHSQPYSGLVTCFKTPYRKPPSCLGCKKGLWKWLIKCGHFQPYSGLITWCISLTASRAKLLWNKKTKPDKCVIFLIFILHQTVWIKLILEKLEPLFCVQKAYCCNIAIQFQLMCSLYWLCGRFLLQNNISANVRYFW